MIKWTDSSYILFKGFANNSTNLLLTKTYSQINSDYFSLIQPIETLKINVCAKISEIDTDWF